MVYAGQAYERSVHLTVGPAVVVPYRELADLLLLGGLALNAPMVTLGVRLPDGHWHYVASDSAFPVQTVGYLLEHLRRSDLPMELMDLTQFSGARVLARPPYSFSWGFGAPIDAGGKTTGAVAVFDRVSDNSP